MILVGTYEHKREGDPLFRIRNYSEKLGVVILKHQLLLVGEYDFIPDGGLVSSERRANCPYTTDIWEIQDDWLYHGVVFNKESDIWGITK